MEECAFCKICKGGHFVYDNKDFYVIFDVHPVSPGHALVIPKKHRVSLFDLNSKEWLLLKDAISAAIKHIKNTNLRKLYSDMKCQKITPNSLWFCNKMLRHSSLNKKPDGYNIGNNEGKFAGRTINHLHIQIIPRYRGDVKDYIGGIRNIIPLLGNYKKIR